MVPVETVFNRFPRMIRDIAKDLGKEIELKMSGEETELDRTVIDEIGDPLIHLLRNSCDHGLESTEKRKELGKSEVGRINLTAYQSGNNVLIEVEDDGAGINIEKIKNKAVENGMAIIDRPCRVLAVCAHPDDLEFFAGGLLKLMQLKGHEIHIIDVTDGEKGVRIKNLAQKRIKEQLEAGKVLGINNIQFLHLPDMRLKEIRNLSVILKDYIENIEPDIVLTFDYDKPIKAIIHPDHVKTGKSTMEAVKLLTDKKPVLLYYASREPNSIIDITSYIEDKVNAVQKHKSQLRFSPKPYGSMVKIFGKYNSLNSRLKYAESFRIG
jgi:LmbE family N-acetylglucosaminyl deacetylase